VRELVGQAQGLGGFVLAVQCRPAFWCGPLLSSTPFHSPPDLRPFHHQRYCAAGLRGKGAKKPTLVFNIVPGLAGYRRPRPRANSTSTLRVQIELPPTPPPTTDMSISCSTVGSSRQAHRLGALGPCHPATACDNQNRDEGPAGSIAPAQRAMRRHENNSLAKAIACLRYGRWGNSGEARLRGIVGAAGDVLDRIISRSNSAGGTFCPEVGSCLASRGLVGGSW